MSDLAIPRLHHVGQTFESAGSRGLLTPCSCRVDVMNFPMQRIRFSFFCLLSFFAVVLCAASQSRAQTDIDLNAREQAIIAAAQPVSAPQFNGAKIIGLHPGQPLIYSLTVSGDRPLTFSTHNLPIGLTLDPGTGLISGT